MNESVVIRNSYEKALAVKQLQEMRVDEPITVQFKKYSGKRSLSANAQQHVWYKDIAEHEQCDVRFTGNKCKLLFGLPILLADEVLGPKIDFVLKRIGFYEMTYEQQINVMDIIQVTSLFKTKQHNEYRDNLQQYYADHGLYLEYQKC